MNFAFTEEEYKAYRKVERVFATEDAKAQVAWLCDRCGYNLSPDLFDYDVLVDMYFKSKDCDVAENDTWDNVIRDYVRKQNSDIRE